MRFRIDKPLDIISEFKEYNQAFKLISTLLTKTIITDTENLYYVSKSNLKMRELALIKSVKDYVIKHNIKTHAERKKIQYIDRAILKNGVYENDLYEIDLKAAYWNLAYKNKFISKEIFERGNNTKLISKKARLIALGNLAKRSYIMEYDGFGFGKSEIETSEGTENIFFKVSQQTDAIMTRLKLLCGNDYLFYWVDAIFLKGERAKNEIESYLKSRKMEFKTIPLTKIEKTDGQIKVWDLKRDKPRPFMFESLKATDLTSEID